MICTAGNLSPSLTATWQNSSPALLKTKSIQAMEGLVYNLNSMHSRAGAQVPFSSLNLGCDTTPEGRMVTRCLLLAYEKGLGHGETPIFPNIIFRSKAGINFNPGDPNYDLFKLAMRVSASRLNPTFSFMDSSFNQPFGTEVAYMGCRTRVIADRHGPATSDGRGNLSFTSFNLPRLAIRADGDLQVFYDYLETEMNLISRMLLTPLSHPVPPESEGYALPDGAGTLHRLRSPYS